MTQPHLCLSCVHAEWKRTANGRLHPHQMGMCRWKLSSIDIPAAFYWGYAAGDQPHLSGGLIERNVPVVACKTYEAKQNG